MKKFFSLVSVLGVIVTLCSCGRSPHITPVTTGISFTAELTYSGESYTVFATVNGNGDTDVAFNSPKALNGLTLHFTEDGATANYKELEYKYDISSVPEGAVCTCLYKILRDVAKRGNVTAENDCYFAENNIGKIKYRMDFGATGLPISVTEGKNGFSASFKNVTVLKN